MTRALTARSRGPGGPTTLSSLASSGEISGVAPRSRLGVIVGVSAVMVGSTIGSALALRGEPESARMPAVAAAQPRAPSGSASSPAALGPAALGPAALGPAALGPAALGPAALGPAASGPAVAAASAANPPSAAIPPPAAVANAAAAPPSPEARAALVAQIKDALRRFVAWSHAHPGARCPDAAALGVGQDPWGQPLRIVCSDQPPDQIAGVLSYGPDGEPGTRDDIVSWMLGPDVTELAHGPRWSASRGIAAGAGGGSRRGGAHPGGPRAVPPAPAPPAAAPPQPPTPPAGASTGSNDTDGDGIPDRR